MIKNLFPLDAFVFMSVKRKKNLNSKKKDREYIPTNEDNYMSNTKSSESIDLSKEDSGLLSEEDENIFNELDDARREMRQIYREIRELGKSNPNSNPNPNTLSKKCTQVILNTSVKVFANGIAQMTNEMGHAFLNR